MQKIVLATSNQGKIREMADVLASFGSEVVAQSEFGIESSEETSSTVPERALSKARYAAKIAGLPAIAEQSCFNVMALPYGAPGPNSARYAGVEGDGADAANRAKLLRESAFLSDDQRDAKYVSCIVLIRHETDPNPIIAWGKCYGTLLREERGSNGFGYDALFFSPETQCSFAELDIAEKKRISHLARSLQSLKKQLEQL